MTPRPINASTLPATHRFVLLGLAALWTLIAPGCPSQPEEASSPAPVAERMKSSVRASRPTQADRPLGTAVVTPTPGDAAGPVVIDLTATTNASLPPAPEPPDDGATPLAAEAAVDGNSPPTPAPSGASVAPDAGSPAAENPPGPPDPADEAQTPPAPTPPTPTTLDPATCRAACDNALAVTLAELPDATAPSMREELKRVLDTECPSRCLAKASIESAHCIANARSALALASCP